MRLREIEFHLSEVIKLLNTFSGVRMDNYSPARYDLQSLPAIRQVISILNGLNLFKDETEVLRLSSVSNNSMETIQASVEEYNKISAAISRIKSNSKIALEALNVALPENKDEELTIYIRLPEFKDFDDLSELMDQLKKAIQLPILLEGIEGEIYIKNFDSGSKWFEIVVKSVTAVSLIGSIAWSGAVIYKKFQEAKVVEEHARSVKLGNEHLEALIKANDVQLTLLIEAEAQHIQKEFFKTGKPEDLERLKLSIKTMSELIEKGTQVQPALLAPENVSNLFPNYSNLMLTESKQKLLKAE